MAEQKTHYVGQLQHPGGRPENVELIVNRRYPARLVSSFTDQDATPSVKSNDNNKIYKTANTVATTITDFDDGFIGQTIDVIVNDANTTIDFTGTNLTRGAGTDWSASSGDYMRCTYDGSTWFCITWDIAIAGADAQAVTLSSTSQIFSYDNSTGSPVLVGPSTIVFTCNRQNIAGSTTWALEDDIASDETAKLTSTSNTSATLTEANFAAISNNTFVKCTATADGISSAITVVKLTSGADGAVSYIGNVYLRKGSAPTEPVTDDGSYNFTTATLTAPSIAGGSADNWSTSVPTADGNPLYLSQGLFQVGAAGGTDSTVDWTAPVVLNSDGAVGADGNSVYVASVYLRKATTPTEPINDDGSYNFTTNELTAPSTAGGSADNWATTPPATDGNSLYVSTGVFSIQGVTGTDSTVDWTAPAIMVTDGVNPVVSQLTNSAVVVSSDYDGTNYVLTGAGGTHEVYKGSTNVTTSATHNVVGGAGSPHVLAQNGLTMSIVVATGIYSLSGASWTTNEESFTLRATYDGNNYDKVYTIAKSKQAQTAKIAALGVSIIDFQTTPADAATGCKIDSDGDIYTYNTISKSYASIGTWLLSGAAGDYDVMVDTYNVATAMSGSDKDTWLGCGSDRAWTYEITGLGSYYTWATLKWRDASTLEILGQSSFYMSCEVDSGV